MFLLHFRQIVEGSFVYDGTISGVFFLHDHHFLRDDKPSVPIDDSDPTLRHASSARSNYDDFPGIYTGSHHATPTFFYDNIGWPLHEGCTGMKTGRL